MAGKGGGGDRKISRRTRTRLPNPDPRGDPEGGGSRAFGGGDGRRGPTCRTGPGSATGGQRTGGGSGTQPGSPAGGLVPAALAQSRDPRPPRAVPRALTALAHAPGAQHGQLDVLGQEDIGGGLGDGREQKVPGHAGQPRGARVPPRRRPSCPRGRLLSGPACGRARRPPPAPPPARPPRGGARGREQRLGTVAAGVRTASPPGALRSGAARPRDPRPWKRGRRPERAGRVSRPPPRRHDSGALDQWVNLTSGLGAGGRKEEGKCNRSDVSPTAGGESPVECCPLDCPKVPRGGVNR